MNQVTCDDRTADRMAWAVTIDAVLAPRTLIFGVVTAFLTGFGLGRMTLPAIGIVGALLVPVLFMWVFFTTARRATRTLAPAGALLSATLTSDGALRFTGATGTTEIRPSSLVGFRTRRGFHILRLRETQGTLIAIPAELLDAGQLANLMAAQGAESSAPTQPAPAALPPPDVHGHRYEIVPTQADIDAVTKHTLRPLTRGPLTLVIALAVASQIALYAMSREYLTLLFATALVIVYVFLVLRMRRTVRANLAAPMRTTFTDEGIHLDSVQGRAVFGYSHVTAAVARPGSVELRLRNRARIVLPEALVPRQEWGHLPFLGREGAPGQSR